MTLGTAARSARLLASAEPTRSLKVGGITPYTTQEYPDKAAAVVYVQGCPWKCAYCHNPHLQLGVPKSPLDWSRILNLLESRVGVINAVFFTGGEPTHDLALPAALRDVRELGFSIGLHTNGAYPERLEAVLPALDWVVLDIKAPFPRYDRITGTEGSGACAEASARLILESGVRHQFRTTVHPSLLGETDIADMARALAALGAQSLAVQSFRAQGCANKALNEQADPAYPSAGLMRKLDSMFPRFAFHTA
jgi:pyruvate formate lyase activating enzyme